MNKIREHRLQNEYQKLVTLSKKSPLFNIISHKSGVNGGVPDRYVLHFKTKGLAKRGAKIVEIDSHIIALDVPAGYPRKEPPRVFYLAPENPWHPNTAGHLICLGSISPNISLDELCVQIHTLIGYQNGRFSMNDLDALNLEAARWARKMWDRAYFPIDPRPLIGEKIEIEVWK